MGFSSARPSLTQSLIFVPGERSKGALKAKSNTGKSVPSLHATCTLMAYLSCDWLSWGSAWALICAVGPWPLGTRRNHFVHCDRIVNDSNLIPLFRSPFRKRTFWCCFAEFPDKRQARLSAASHHFIINERGPMSPSTAHCLQMIKSKYCRRIENVRANGRLRETKKMSIIIFNSGKFGQVYGCRGWEGQSSKHFYCLTYCLLLRRGMESGMMQLQRLHTLEITLARRGPSGERHECHPLASICEQCALRSASAINLSQ